MGASFHKEKGFHGEVAKTGQALLLKPGTYMNRSGQAVAALAGFYKITPDEILVAHDELDLPPGAVKIKQGGGHAGHNGLRSLHEHIGEAYGRVRMGIGHPCHKDAVAAYVLHDFAKADQAWLEDLLRGISDSAGLLAAGDGPKFLNAVALRMAPPRPTNGQSRATAAGPPVAPSAPQPAVQDPQRTALQRLADRFRQT
jgi:PTH1 family peptidyl-tRNA hydrolase